MKEQQLDLGHHIPPHLFEAGLYVEQELAKAGFQAYLVGGSVRDLLLQKDISDIDFTTNARPEQVMKVFPRVVPVGVDFGTVLVLYKKISIEVTTFRLDTEYSDGRHPNRVFFGHSLSEDVHRRDFTINGLAYHLSSCHLYDYVGGMADLQNRVLRTIGDPLERFSEDGLRPIRGCRFMAALNFAMESQTRQAIRDSLATVAQIATERLYDEWRKTIKIENRHLFWQALFETGIFSIFFQVFSHLEHDHKRQQQLFSLLRQTRPRRMGIYAAYFFFIDFADDDLSMQVNDERLHTFFKQQRFPAKEENLCRSLVHSPLFNLVPELKTTGQVETVSLKKAFSQIRPDYLFYHLRFFYEILHWHFTDHPHSPLKDLAISLLKNLRSIVAAPLFVRDLQVNGHDLQKLGLKGRQLGDMLEFLLGQVLLDPAKNQKDVLLALARQAAGR